MVLHCLIAKHWKLILGRWDIITTHILSVNFLKVCIGDKGSRL